MEDETILLLLRRPNRPNKDPSDYFCAGSFETDREQALNDNAQASVSEGNFLLLGLGGPGELLGWRFCA